MPDYFRKGCNAGTGPPADFSYPKVLDHETQGTAASSHALPHKQPNDFNSQILKFKSRNNTDRIQCAVGMGSEAFAELVNKILAAFSKVFKSYNSLRELSVV